MFYSRWSLLPIARRRRPSPVAVARRPSPSPSPVARRRRPSPSPVAERNGSTLGRLHHNLFKRVKHEYGPKYDPNFDWTKKNLMLH